MAFVLTLAKFPKNLDDLNSIEATFKETSPDFEMVS